MKHLMTYKHSLVTVLFLFCISVVTAQSTYKESFTVKNDAVVEVNTSHTNVIFETWNKDKPWNYHHRKWAMNILVAIEEESHTCRHKTNRAKR